MPLIVAHLLSKKMYFVAYQSILYHIILLMLINISTQQNRHTRRNSRSYYWLATDKSKYTTGQSILLDGGLSL